MVGVTAERAVAAGAAKVYPPGCFRSWEDRLRPCAIVLFVAGCADPFEGTWLFRVEREPAYDGTCDVPANDVDGYGHVLVDVYRTGDDGVVVLFEEPLVGTVEAGRLRASWEETNLVGSSTQASELAIDAALEAGMLAGEIARRDAVDDVACDQTWDFEGERIVSDPDAYAAGG